MSRFVGALALITMVCSLQAQTPSAPAAPTPAYGQAQQVPQAQAPLASTVNSDSLRLGRADEVQVRVLEAPELDEETRVTDSGVISLRLGGEVNVLGLTPREAADLIAERLRLGQYILDPHVLVSTSQYATQNVSVLGQVRLPGSYPIGTPRPVLDVIAMAGGLTEMANRHMAVLRGGKESVPFYFSNSSRELASASVTVSPGDTIYVPRVDVVYVLGDVGKPGGFPVDTNTNTLSAVQALTLAGSSKPSAVPSQAKLLRLMPDGTRMEMTIQLNKMQRGRIPDMPLQADDIIYVPFSYLRNAATNLTAILAAASTAAVYQF